MSWTVNWNAWDMDYIGFSIHRSYEDIVSTYLLELYSDMGTLTIL